MTTSSPEKRSKYFINVEAENALKWAKSGKSFFITGPAGSGKSVLLKNIRDELSPFKKVAVTAPTGISAENVLGQTIHSFSGINLFNSQEKPESIEKRIRKHKTGVLTVSRWRNTDVLIIDECSMISGEMFDVLDYLGKQFREEENEYFGGMQVIVIGDFYQLEPIKSSYLFQSKIFQEMFIDTKQYICLTHIYRQQDPLFLNGLNDMRLGILNEEFLSKIQENNRKWNEQTQDIVPTKLYCRNEDVERCNIYELSKLRTEKFTFKAIDRIYKSNYPKQFITFPVDDSIDVKVGAQIMFLKNTDDYKNGTRGVITEINEEDKMITVKLRNETILNVSPVVFEIKKNDDLVATRRMFPFKLAWAISIHKSQSLTESWLEVNLNGVFQPAQAYVALSRATSMDGLYVIGLKKDGVYCNPLVVEFYNKLNV